MMFAAVADVHVGNIAAHGGRMIGSVNQRCRDTLATLARAVEVANENQAPLIVLGDLFDASRPPPAIISATAIVLERVEAGVHVLVGNHDMNSDAPLDNACSPFRLPILVYESPTVVKVGGYMMGMVPFQPGPAREWLPDVVRELVNIHPFDVLCLHLGISDDDTPSHLEGHDDEVPVELVKELCSTYEIDHVIAGNWHWHQQWPTLDDGSIVQVGTLAPVRHTDDGYNAGGVLLMGKDHLEYRQVIGPRFVTVDECPVEESRVGEYITGMIKHAADNLADPFHLKVRLPERMHEDVRYAAHNARAASGMNVTLELQEVADQKLLDETELGKQIAKLSDLPVEVAVMAVGDEVAEEEGLDGERLALLLQQYWGAA